MRLQSRAPVRHALIVVLKVSSDSLGLSVRKVYVGLTLYFCKWSFLLSKSLQNKLHGGDLRRLELIEEEYVS